MDITAIRQRNLAHLAGLIQEASTTKLRQQDIAAELDMSASFLAQLLKGKRMGDAVAREIEKVRALPHGWMDQPQWPESTRIGEPVTHYVHASHPAGISPRILAAAYELARLACLNLEVSFEPETEEDADVVLRAYTYLQIRRESGVTGENVVDFTKLLRKRRGERHAAQGSTSARSAGAGAGQEGPSENVA